MAFEKMESAGYLANHMARLFAQGLHERISELGIVPGQFPALLILWEEEGLTQRDLVERLDVEQATIANTLTRMERDGLIIRKRHPSDGRAQQIWLTDKARALQKPATEAAKAQNAKALERLDRQEKKQFLEFMRRVISSMREAE